VANTKPILLGPNGQPIQRDVLTQAIAGPSLYGGVRSPFGGYPGDGLTPVRLASIMREADHGDPIRYFELAEQVEERDLHYVGVLGTRKRSVSQLDAQVEAASDDPQHVAHAEMIRNWLTRDELEDELFDMLDCIGKGISFTEIIWDTSAGQWQPARLERRDQRWFRFDRADGATPLLRTEFGDVRLQPFKFITAVIRAKSGLPVRSGIARLACWSWMFKAFTLRDWAIFTQTFGQPVRVGKYPAGATESDKSTLFRAVANIAGDMAAIVPESMIIDFIESANIGPSHALYKERADWLDQQVSKLVLGQTATTDAIAGGHAVGREHRKVQEDIERADAKAISAILNRDLVKPWIDLEFGPQTAYPKLRIGRPDEQDVAQLTTTLEKLVPLGLKVQMSEVRDRLGFAEPEPDAVLLTAPAATSPFGGNFSMNAAQPAHTANDAIKVLADQAESLADDTSDQLFDEIRAIIERCSSFEEVKAALKKFKPGAAEKNLAGMMRMARVIANLTGRADITDQAEE
jgi:phage gp29-like protein